VEAAHDMLAPWFAPVEERREHGLPNGRAAAAILAAGIGSTIYGLLVLLAEAIPAVHASPITARRTDTTTLSSPG
jgi:hypothetical protein